MQMLLNNFIQLSINGNDFFYFSKDGLFKILPLKAYLKVHQVPLRNFKDVSLYVSGIQMATVDRFKVSFGFKFR